MWDVAGESVAQKRLPQFLTLQFRPWPLECVDEAMEAKAKSELAAKEKEYKKQMVQREAMKHIDEIRKKLGWIDAFRERRRRILETMETMGGEKKAMEDKEEDMVEMWENERRVMCREVEEEVELLELKIEACLCVCWKRERKGGWILKRRVRVSVESEWKELETLE